MSVKIQLRRNTNAYWSGANPTLLSGEIIIASDTKKFKIGPGAYNSLTFADSTTGVNLSGSGKSVFTALSGTVMKFRTLISSTNITLTSAANTVTINATVPIKTVANISVGKSLYKQLSGTIATFRTLLSGSNITLTSGVGNVTVNATVPVTVGANLATPNVIYRRLSGTKAVFANLVSGTGITLASSATGITITSTATGGGSSTWTAVSGTPAYVSTSTMSMSVDNRATIYPGYGLKFTHGGVVKYAMVTAIASALITFAGAPLASAGVSLVKWCPNYNTEVLTFGIPGYWADATDSTLLANDLLMAGGFNWRKGPAHIVKITGIVTTADTSSNPWLNLTIGGASGVATTNTNKGIAISGTVATTGIDINTAQYALTYGSLIELKATASGGGNNSSNLLTEIVVVYD